MSSTAEKQKQELPKDVMVFVKVPRPLHKILKKIAAREDKTLAAVVREGLKRAYVPATA